MKRVLMLFICVILLTSVISATIIVNEQPKDLYNLGEVIKIPAKIAASSGINEFLSVKLICNGKESEVHKQYIFLNPGEEQGITIAIPLITSFIGQTTGTCLIKPTLGNDFILTKEFTISDYIAVEVKLEETEFSPGEIIVVEGTAIKDNGKGAQGYVDAKFLSESFEEILSITDTIKEGQMNLNLEIPEDMPAGYYLLQFDVYEKGTDNNKTNHGYAEADLRINQVPTNLEIIFEKRKATPGEDYNVKAVLHDQSGEKIDTDVEIKIRNSDDKLITSEDVATDEFINIPLEYSEPADMWTVYAKARGVESEATFEIIEKHAVGVEILNRTVVLTNKGNIPYNDTVVIKIGNDTVELDAFIPVGDYQKYTLSAPDGEYEIEIHYGDDDKVQQKVMLTGNAIGVERVSGIGWIFGSFVWVFMIAVLGFVAFTVYKKGYKKTFLGRIIPRRKPKDKTTDKDIVTASTLIVPKHPAHLSLSIKGHKQNTSVICLKIKNEDEVLKNQESVKEVFDKITSIAEDNKASVYENKSNIFFIFAPERTKTFNNQKTAVKTAEKIKEILDIYNKLAKCKVSYGIGLNFGTIIAKHDKNKLEFMSMGTLITVARKLATHSREDVLISEELNDKLRADIKSEKHEANNLTYYTLTEVKVRGADNKKFISNFIRKLEAENKAKKEEKKE